MSNPDHPPWDSGVDDHGNPWYAYRIAPSYLRSRARWRIGLGFLVVVAMMESVILTAALFDLHLTATGVLIFAGAGLALGGGIPYAIIQWCLRDSCVLCLRDRLVCYLGAPWTVRLRQGEFPVVQRDATGTRWRVMSSGGKARSFRIPVSAFPRLDEFLRDCVSTGRGGRGPA